MRDFAVKLEPNKIMKGKFALLILAVAFTFGPISLALAEDAPQLLSSEAAPQTTSSPYVSKFELESQLSQVHSELRSLRDLTELRLNSLDNEITVSSSYVEKLLFAFMIAGAFVVSVVLMTINKESSVNNERMRNLIREAESSLDNLHRMMDRPEAEHFHVSRKLSRIMNKMRERENPSLPQKEIGDIYAASEDPTLPVSLHLQANALRNEQRGDWSNAIHLWEKLLSIDDASPEILLHLAQNYKKLAQVSTGDHASQLREASLDYFQKYSVRTNLHTHSERELRKMASLGLMHGEVSNLNGGNNTVSDDRSDYATSGEQAQVAVVTAQPITKQPNPAQPKALNMQEYKALKKKKAAITPTRRKSVTESLLAIKSSVSLRKPLLQKSVEDAKANEAQPAAAASPSIGSNKTQPVVAVSPSNGSSKTQPVVAANAAPLPDKQEPSTTLQVASSKNLDQVAAESKNANGNAKAEKALAEKVIVGDKEEVAAEVKVSAVESQPVQTGKVAKARPEVSSANGNNANGAGDHTDEAISSPQPVQGKAAKAYKSRMDKAKEYFTRYGSAKTKKNKMTWLQGALDEFEAASKYSTELEMYRLWGMTVLEKAMVDKGNEQEHVAGAVKVFEMAAAHHASEFCNELSLCHAILGDEGGCRKALEQASERGTLDPDFFLSLPDFEKFKGKSWFKKLEDSYSA